MGWIILIRPYLEVISFVATTILAVGLFLSRQQLSAFRKDIIIRNDRQAKEKAVEAARYYMIDYVNASAVLFNSVNKDENPVFVGKVGNFSFASLSKSEVEAGLRRASNSLILSVLNNLEIVSAYFVSGVADEKTGFQIIGKSFCSTVAHNYAAITILRDEKSSQNYWFNIIELFKVWNSRIKRMDLARESEELQNSLREIPEVRISAIGCAD